MICLNNKYDKTVTSRNEYQIREIFGENRRNNIPPHLLEYCFSKRVQKELSYPRVLREDRIAACSNLFLNTELTINIYIDYLREDEVA